MSNFLDMIKKQRSASKYKKFKGTFLDYLRVIQEEPETVKLAHKRLYEAILKFGMDTVDVDSDQYRDIFNGDKIRTYDYFEK